LFLEEFCRGSPPWAAQRGAGGPGGAGGRRRGLVREGLEPGDVFLFSGVEEVLAVVGKEVVHAEEGDRFFVPVGEGSARPELDLGSYGVVGLAEVFGPEVVGVGVADDLFVAVFGVGREFGGEDAACDGGDEVLGEVGGGRQAGEVLGHDLRAFFFVFFEGGEEVADVVEPGRYGYDEAVVVVEGVVAGYLAGVEHGEDGVFLVMIRELFVGVFGEEVFDVGLGVGYDLAVVHVLSVEV